MVAEERNATYSSCVRDAVSGECGVWVYFPEKKHWKYLLSRCHIQLCFLACEIFCWGKRARPVLRSMVCSVAGAAQVLRVIGADQEPAVGFTDRAGEDHPWVYMVGSEAANWYQKLCFCVVLPSPMASHPVL